MFGSAYKYMIQSYCEATNKINIEQTKYLILKSLQAVSLVTQDITELTFDTRPYLLGMEFNKCLI